METFSMDPKLVVFTCPEAAEHFRIQVFNWFHDCHFFHHFWAKCALLLSATVQL